MIYLILHKVRGEPAFDIAEPIMIGDEEGWIIPTSGHRAYPHRTWKLDDLSDISDINSAGYHNRPAAFDSVPDDLPDHYTITKAGVEQKVDYGALFGAVMNAAVGKFPRRA